MAILRLVFFLIEERLTPSSWDGFLNIVYNTYQPILHMVHQQGPEDHNLEMRSCQAGGHHNPCS